MTTHDLAAAAGVTPNRIAELVRQKVISATKLGNMWIFDKAALKAVEAWKKTAGRPRRADLFREVDSGAPFDLAGLEEAGAQVGRTGRTIRRMVETGALQGWRKGGISMVSVIELRALLAQALPVTDDDRDPGPVGGLTALKPWSAAA